MMTIIKDENFKKIADGVKPDSRKRVILPKSLIGDGVTYRVYSNSIGQIILDPQVTIPSSELWAFGNAEVLASINRGLTDAVKGNVSKVDLDTL